MDLLLHETPDSHLYHNLTQRARVITESWTQSNLYCPICGAPHLKQFEASRPVADFYCEHCGAQFEQKSFERKQSCLPKKIAGSGYEAMKKRLSSDTNPHLLILTHIDEKVNNLVLIPKHFFTTSVIEKRKATHPKGRPKPWIGCNIILEGIPESGRIYLIKDGVEQDQDKVSALYKKTLPLKTRDLESASWLMDVLKCVETIPSDDFSLNDVYAFEPDLTKKHPENSHIKDKIRQQLQILRDKGFIEFVARGKYKKIALRQQS